MSAKEPDPFILFSDSALSELEHDAFDLEKKLGVIRSAILNPKTETPFTVMVTGGWGSGKTSAMAWLQKDLEARAKNAGEDEIKADTCWFYPWKYQNQEDVWRGLISEVILAAIDFDNVDAAKVVKAAKQFGSFLGRGFVRILSSVKITGKTKMGAVEAGAELSLKEALGGVIEEYGKSVTPQEAYFNEFESVLKRWVADSYPKNGNQRLVVFIDDLDRCLPKIALQVLEALKLYLNIPNLIFVVGVDRTVIDQIVTKSYCDMVGDKAMEGKFKDKAAKYLDKMFQVEIHVEPTDHEISTFFAKKVEESEAWKSMPDEIKATLRVLLTKSDLEGGISDRTPRTMVRQLNRLLAAAQRDSGDGSLLPSQIIQREMIDLVCQEAGHGENLPQRNLRGRQFFHLWSDIIQKHLKEIKDGTLASYLPSSELKRKDVVRQNATSKQPESIASGFGIDVFQWQKEAIRYDFSHLDPLRHPDYTAYEQLLTSAPLARLLEIPYTVTKKEATSDLDVIRGWLAPERGIQPDRISDQEILDLTELRISNLEITDLSPLICLTRLQILECYNTKIVDLTPLSNLANLQELYCFQNNFSDLSPLTNLINLKVLICGESQISDLSPLRSLVQLEELWCSNSRVTSISVVSELRQLNELAFTGTQVSDLSPLFNLINLQYLYCNNTKVSDLSPLHGLKNLKSVRCANTEVTKEEVERLQEALPNCRIYSDFD